MIISPGTLQTLVSGRPTVRSTTILFPAISLIQCGTPACSVSCLINLSSARLFLGITCEMLAILSGRGGERRFDICCRYVHCILEKMQLAGRRRQIHYKMLVFTEDLHTLILGPQNSRSLTSCLGPCQCSMLDLWAYYSLCFSPGTARA